MHISPTSASYCFFSECEENIKVPLPDLYTDQESAESNSDPKPFDTRPDGKKNESLQYETNKNNSLTYEDDIWGNFFVKDVIKTKEYIL